MSKITALYTPLPCDPNPSPNTFTYGQDLRPGFTFSGSVRLWPFNINSQVLVKQCDRFLTHQNGKIDNFFTLQCNYYEIRKWAVARWRQMAWCLRYTSARGFIPKKIQWHRHAGSWSLVNCLAGSFTRHYIRCSWILIKMAVGLTAGLGLDGDRCIRVIPRHPPFSMKEEALPACKETIVRNIPWSLRDRVMQQIWMYYKKSLRKTLLTSIHSRPVCP